MTNQQTQQIRDLNLLINAVSAATKNPSRKTETAERKMVKNFMSRYIGGEVNEDDLNRAMAEVWYEQGH